MASANTLLNYEVALEMKWFTQALQNQFSNYTAGCEFYKTLLYFKNIDEKVWPLLPNLKDHDVQNNYSEMEKYFFRLQNLYAKRARARIDAIRESYGNDADIPDVIETKTVNEIRI